jgi:hypothetical protein
MNKQLSDKEKRRVAEVLRDACLRAALDAYERAGLAGLCEEGCWEMAVDALKTLNVDEVIRAVMNVQ